MLFSEKSLKFLTKERKLLTIDNKAGSFAEARLKHGQKEVKSKQAVGQGKGKLSLFRSF